MTQSRVQEGPAAADVAPYDAVEELAGHLTWARAVVARGVSRFRAQRAPAEAPGLAGVAIFDAEVDRLLEPVAEDTLDLDPLALDATRASIEILQRTLATPLGTRLHVRSLRRAFELSSLETGICVLAAAPSLDPSFGRLFAFLNNDVGRPHLSPALALALLGNDLASRTDVLLALDERSVLRARELVHVAEGQGPLEGAVGVPASVVRHLLGRADPPEGRIEVGVALDELILAPDARDEIARAAVRVGEVDPPVVITVAGNDHCGRATIAATLARHAGRTAYRYRLSEQTRVEDVRRWLRDVRLQDGAPALVVEPGCAAATRLCDEMSGGAFPISFAIHGPSFSWVPEREGAVWIHVGVPDPNPASRYEAWRRFLRSNRRTIADADARTVSHAFPFTIPQIARLAKAAAARDAAGDASRPLDPAALLEVCRVHARHRLDALAVRVETSHRWDDLVLPREEHSQLRELARAAVRRVDVLEGLGFADRRGSAAMGISALFFGPSGTGKTMAAGILARELKMALYRVDLSRVVNKYIGETEKNLEVLFEEARRAYAVLFFDEADALFGKRSDVKDAHDRYANLEVAYLLQKMESHDGITILATNLRKNLDQAFSRRLQFSVEFPHPDERLRARLWKSVWPDKVELAGDVDLAFLAKQFDLTGGHIRNVAVRAAYFAVEAGGPIKMAHLLVATRREYQKLGRVLVDNDFGAYRRLLEGSA